MIPLPPSSSTKEAVSSRLIKAVLKKVTKNVISIIDLIFSVLVEAFSLPTSFSITSSRMRLTIRVKTEMASCAPKIVIVSATHSAQMGAVLPLESSYRIFRLKSKIENWLLQKQFKVPVILLEVFLL